MEEVKVFEIRNALRFAARPRLFSDPISLGRVALISFPSAASLFPTFFITLVFLAFSQPKSATFSDKRSTAPELGLNTKRKQPPFFLVRDTTPLPPCVPQQSFHYRFPSPDGVIVIAKARPPELPRGIINSKRPAEFGPRERININ